MIHYVSKCFVEQLSELLQDVWCSSSSRLLGNDRPIILLGVKSIRILNSSRGNEIYSYFRALCTTVLATPSEMEIWSFQASFNRASRLSEVKVETAENIDTTIGTKIVKKQLKLDNILIQLSAILFSLYVVRMF